MLPRDLTYGVGQVDLADVVGVYGTVGFWPSVWTDTESLANWSHWSNGRGGLSNKSMG